MAVVPVQSGGANPGRTADHLVQFDCLRTRRDARAMHSRIQVDEHVQLPTGPLHVHGSRQFRERSRVVHNRGEPDIRIHVYQL